MRLKTFRTLVVASSLIVGSLASSAAAYAQATCQPGIGPAVAAHQAAFVTLATALLPQNNALRTQLAAVVDQPTYQTLLTTARAIANGITNGRVLVTLPDGTVVLDTARTDDPTNVFATGNSYQHFQQKTVNENHNSRIAILAAQMFECGLGVESKLSTSTGQREIYLGLRLGLHLDNMGTARASLRQ